MSNEVNKEAEENAEPQSSVEQTNPENSTESKVEETANVVDQTETEEISPENAVVDPDAGGEMDFGAILEQFEQEQTSFHNGELVNGKVVGISDRGVLIDFGHKSEGVVTLEEFTSPEGEVTIEIGQMVDVVIKNMGLGDSPPILSRDDAQRRYSWDKIEEAFNNEVPVKGIVKDKTKGGLKVDVEGVEAFLPGSQIDSRPVRNLDSLKGQEIEAKVIKFSRKRNNIVISRKVLTDEVINKQKAETLTKIGEGFIVEGVVKNLTDYGAFIDIGGIDGLLHVTDMSWGRLQNPNELFKVGDNIQVKILKLDREKEKISLGYKQLLPDPWSTVTEIYPVNGKIKGNISSITEYGAFVELEPGVEGLVHISEMSWSKRLKHPMHIVKKGEEVEVQVLGIDPDERRISLGIKQLQENPWDTIGDRYFIGSKVQGKVRNLTDFGAFVEIEEGVDGLVHISDISWSKKIKHPKEVLKKGQEVEAVVTNIDTSDRRLSLSIKELTPSAWETFTNEHKPGDVVKGKISRFAGFGIFVELAPDLEGLCHISELSDERVENPEDLFEIGQELDFKILRIEHDVEKIGLSHRAVGKEGEPVMDSKSYSSQAKGGMASLGELANLRFGADKKEEAPAAEVPEETVEETAEAVAETETAESESPEVATDTDSTEAEAEVKAETETAAEEKTAETNETEDKGAEATEVETATSETTKEKADEVTESSEEPEESSETPAEEVVSDAPDAKAEETVSEDSPKSETETTVDTETAEEAVAETADAEEKVAETAEVEDAKEVVTETVEAEETEASTETEIAEETENAETGKEISAESSETVEEEKTKEKKAKS